MHFTVKDDRHCDVKKTTISAPKNNGVSFDGQGSRLLWHAIVHNTLVRFIGCSNVHCNIITLILYFAHDRRRFVICLLRYYFNQQNTRMFVVVNLCYFVTHNDKWSRNYPCHLTLGKDTVWPPAGFKAESRVWLNYCMELGDNFVVNKKAGLKIRTRTILIKCIW